MRRQHIRFHWTRGSYRKAHELARLLNRFLDMPDHAPAIVRRYWELWERHPQHEDPLLTPMQLRAPYMYHGDGIPF